MNSNPFSAFLTSGTFLTFGRDSILHELAQVITLPSPDDRDLHGLPGMGKSLLLRYVSSPDFVRHYQDVFFEPYTKKPHLLFISYIAGWIEAIHPFVLLYREFSHTYRDYYLRLSAKHSGLELPDPLDVDVDDLDGDEALSIMEPHLRSLVQAGIRIVILFDDFDSRWAYECFTADESARLSSWKEYCSLIFATERRLEDVNPVSKGSPLYKRLTQTPVRELLEDDARAFLTQILALSQKNLPPEDITLLIRLAGGFPYLLILAGRALWDLRLRTGLSEFPDKPLPEAVKPYLDERLFGEFQRMFEQYYTNRNAEQRQVLLDLAAQSSLLLKSEIDGRQYIQLMGLEQYGLIDINSDGWASLFSPLFRQFLLNQSPSIPAKAAAPNALNLTELQTNLYNIFRSRPDEVVTFGELGQRVWSWPTDPIYEPSEEEKRKIRIAVSKLRRALENSSTGERIVNLRSRGYRFESGR